ncbi:hypothetical protein P7L54_06670 [Acinetobacter bereziniae]|uniref:hypothetical protein n=1 Tax=Acinetobacter bereziniae TaxID=106648 RepID=UPI002412AEC4|nr:hypothetical protein [Acinetobacter bereziniae]MDG3555633.1 hypothetical protein [Acinetobacter bereziniae]
MAYEPPNGKKLKFNFTGIVYTPPSGNRIKFNFTEDGETPIGDTQYLFPVAWESLELGSDSLRHKYRYISPIGFNASNYGTAKLYNKTQKIGGSGFNVSIFGSPSIVNHNKEIKVIGFNSQIFSSLAKVYNLKQIISLNTRGINSATYGVAYLQGGVKYILPNGIDSVRYGVTTVINTRADKYVNLSGKGIIPPLIPNPNVSPRILYPNGIQAWNFGTPLIQRSPSPKGFDTSSYGVAWISHSPRYIQPAKIEAFLSGFPKIYDPTQKIYLADRGFSGGIFGDIAIRNTRRVIGAQGFDALLTGDWSIVESNLRTISFKGFNSAIFGEASVRNKTPSIKPSGFDALNGLNASIGYHIRFIKPSGFYQPKFGSPKLTKPPEIKPIGINQNLFGNAFISNHTRFVYAGLGGEALRFGQHSIWFRYRNISFSGIRADSYGTPRIEHGRRQLLVKGAEHAAYGNQAWLSYGVRSLTPSSIDYPKIPIHRIGGTQDIQPSGFIATLFGTRIIPESQSIYPQGFANPFGLAFIDLWKKYIQPKGFLTTGQEAGHRFGTSKFWNKRQYITMFFDGDSGLVPPKWNGWTSVGNRNKTIGAIGSNFSKVFEPSIENKARSILPHGIDQLNFGRLMIADRVRKLRLQGIEAPYFSGWSVVYNSAFVIAPKGMSTQSFGLANIANNRRYYNRIGNFESLEFGKPMIADRIRTLKIEQRYTISPPHIPIHRIYLYTRYIEEVGRFDDHQAFGTPSLSIHWNKITTRWSHRDLFGEPVLHNVTPELGVRGHNSEEFGQANIRTQWRNINQLGSESLLWGKSEIAFRDRQFSVMGFTQWAIPTHKVTKTGVPPYFPQYIWLSAVEIDGIENGGHGIPIPVSQVSTPSLRTNVIYASGFVASQFGIDTQIQSNGILMEYGISMPLFEQGPTVTLKNRTVSVDKGIDSSIIVGTPRFSPHTIYAVMDAPEQAKQNHPPASLHYVNSDNGNRPPGEVFGRTRITLKHRVLQNLGLGNLSGYGTPQIQLKRRYIQVKGMQLYRMGWYSVGDGTQQVTQFSSAAMALFGKPSLQIKEPLHRAIKPSGFDALNLSTLDWVSHFHRKLLVNGFDALRVGTGLSGDTPFMWQGLRVGELVKGNYGGFTNEAFGKAWISLKVRDLKAQGFDSFVMEYDYTQFDKRMRVTGTVVEIPAQTIQAVGFDAFRQSVPNIKPAVHYIRPDGNADQFRKGAF